MLTTHFHAHTSPDRAHLINVTAPAIFVPTLAILPTVSRPRLKVTASSAVSTSAFTSSTAALLVKAHHQPARNLSPKDVDFPIFSFVLPNHSLPPGIFSRRRGLNVTKQYLAHLFPAVKNSLV